MIWSQFFHLSTGYIAGTLWVGPYGESRKRLLEFLLEKTK